MRFLFLGLFLNFYHEDIRIHVIDVAISLHLV